VEWIKLAQDSVQCLATVNTRIGAVIFCPAKRLSAPQWQGSVEYGGRQCCFALERSSGQPYGGVWAPNRDKTETHNRPTAPTPAPSSHKPRRGKSDAVGRVSGLWRLSRAIFVRSHRHQLSSYAHPQLTVHRSQSTSPRGLGPNGGTLRLHDADSKTREVTRTSAQWSTSYPHINSFRLCVWPTTQAVSRRDHVAALWASTPVTSCGMLLISGTGTGFPLPIDTPDSSASGTIG
jgi:hypothetical protein